MSRFVLTAQLQLQAPRNTRQVVTQMQQQLGSSLNVQINPVVNTQALANAQKQVTQVSTAATAAAGNLNKAARSADSFGSALGAAARRFASITLATGFFLGITRAMGSAVGRAVEFEKEMLKISQVTGKTVMSLQGLSGEVTKLATTLGVSSEEILNSARTLSQAGLAADQVTKSLKILAQTDLAATFDNIADTTEGAVALINQFRQEVRAAGSEAKFLENALDAINAVSKNFAVESADLISVVRRTGGVFEAAGGKLNELIALFTSVRSTTRETAETIATGFRTIFTRIQRTETIDQLKELGIVLQDAKGQFVGPLEAISRLSAGLKSLDPRDFRFNEIVEQLGGFRQIGKVIPLIKQYQTSVAALAVANSSMGATAYDAQIAQQGLGNQFAQLKEKFDATIRSIADSNTFRSIAEGAIKLAESILKIVEAMEPLLPMLTALAAFKLGQIAVPAIGRFAGVGGRNEGGRIHGVHAFNRGGYVPGTGNRDTVPAMLTPGEFVIRKSSVKKIGAAKLAKMNGYQGGGTVRNFGTAVFDDQDVIDTRTYPVTAGMYFTDRSLESRMTKSASRNKVSLAELEQQGIKSIAGSNTMKLAGVGSLYPRFQEAMNSAMVGAVDAGVASLDGIAAGIDIAPLEGAQKENFISTLKGKYGNLFEQMVQKMSGAGFDGGQDNERPIDLLGGLGPLASVFPSLAGLTAIELKSSLTAANSKNKTTGLDGLHQKIINYQGFGVDFESIAKQMKAGEAGELEATGRKKKEPSLFEMAGVNKGGRKNFFGGLISKYAVGGPVESFPSLQVRDSIKRGGLKYSKPAGEAWTEGQSAFNPQDTVNFNRLADNARAIVASDFKLKPVEIDGRKEEIIDPSDVDGLNIAKRYGSGNDRLRGQAYEELMTQKGVLGPKPTQIPGEPFDGLMGNKWQEAKSYQSETVTDTEIADKALRASIYGRNKMSNVNMTSRPEDLNLGMQVEVVKDLPQQSMATIKELLNNEKLYQAEQAEGQRLNSGGKADTVPAMLTPGEYVINKKAAQNIGYGNLNRMNKHGVAHFNKGGPVQYFANGSTGTGVSGGAGGMNVGAGVNTSMEALAQAATKLSYKLDTIGAQIGGVADDFSLLASIDEKLMAAVEPLATALANAVDDIGQLQAIDEKINGAITPLTTSISTVAGQIVTIDETIRNSFIAAGEAVIAGTENFSIGISTIDELVRQQFTVAAEAIVAAANNFATGMSAIDDSVKATLTSALSGPMTKAGKELETQMVAFGTELKAKVKVFDQLKDDVAAMQKALQTARTLITEASDDLGTMKDDIFLLSEALIVAAERVLEASDDLKVGIGSGIANLNQALNIAAQNYASTGSLGLVNQSATSMAQSMVNSITSMTTFISSMGSISTAATNFIAALNKGQISITTTATSSSNTGPIIDQLEMRIQELETNMSVMSKALGKAQAQIANMGNQATTAGSQMATGGTAAASRGAAAGAAAGGGGGMMMMNSLMMAGFAAQMLTQDMEGLSDETRAVMDAAVLLGPILLMVASQLGEMAGVAIANTFVGKLDAASTSAHTVAVNADTAATAMHAAVVAGTQGAFIGIAAGLTIAIAASRSYAAAADKARDTLIKGLRGINDAEAAGIDKTEALRQVERALDNEAKSSAAMIGGAALAVVGAIAATAAVIATGGAAAGAIIAAGVAGGVAGGAVGAGLGAAYASADEAALGFSKTLINATFASQTALAGWSDSLKQIELENLEGVDALRRANKAYAEFGAGTSVALATFQKFSQDLASTDQDISDEALDSDTLKQLLDLSNDSLKDGRTEAFKAAQFFEKKLNEAADKIIAGGSSITEVLANPDIKTGLDSFRNSIQNAKLAGLLLSKAMDAEAQQRLGLANIAAEDLTTRQRDAIAAKAFQLAQAKARKDADIALEAQKKAMRERLEAEQEARRVAAVRLAADIELARAAERAASSLNTFEASIIGFSNKLSSIDSELGALTGNIKAMKSSAEDFIGTLESGFITPEAETAASAVGSQFGIQPQVNDLLDNLRNNEKIRTALINDGLSELTGGLEGQAASTQVRSFFASQGLDFSSIAPEIQKQILELLKDGLQPDEIGEIMDMLNAENEHQIKILQELAKVQGKYANSFITFQKAAIDASNKIAAAAERQVNVQIKAEQRRAKAEGRDLNAGELQANLQREIDARLRPMGLQGGGAQAIGTQLNARRQRTQFLQDRIGQAQAQGDDVAVAKLQAEQMKLANESAALTEALKKLADQSNIAAAVLNEISKEDAKKQTVVGQIRDFAFASNKERVDIDRSFMALQRVLQTGNLNSIPDEMRGAVRQLLEQFEDIQVGGGMTGGDVLKRFDVLAATSLEARAKGRPLTKEEFLDVQKRVLGKTDRQQQLLQKLDQIAVQEQAAAAQLRQQEENTTNNLLQGIERLIAQLQGMVIQAGNAAGAGMANNAAAGVAPAPGFHRGGPVYLQNGGDPTAIFKPKGRDTVPAMLQKGEYVVSEKAAKKNAGILEQINGGKVQYFNKGGFVLTSASNYTSGDAGVGDAFENISGPVSASVERLLIAPQKQIMEGDLKASAKHHGISLDGLPKDLDLGNFYLPKSSGDAYGIDGGEIKGKGLTKEGAYGLVELLGVRKAGQISGIVREIQAQGIGELKGEDGADAISKAMATSLGAAQYFGDRTATWRSLFNNRSFPMIYDVSSPAPFVNSNWISTSGARFMSSGSAGFQLPDSDEFGFFERLFAAIGGDAEWNNRLITNFLTGNGTISDILTEKVKMGVKLKDGGVQEYAMEAMGLNFSRLKRTFSTDRKAAQSLNTLKSIIPKRLKGILEERRSGFGSSYAGPAWSIPVTEASFYGTAFESPTSQLMRSFFGQEKFGGLASIMTEDAVMGLMNDGDFPTLVAEFSDLEGAYDKVLGQAFGGYSSYLNDVIYKNAGSLSILKNFYKRPFDYFKFDGLDSISEIVNQMLWGKYSASEKADAYSRWGHIDNPTKYISDQLDKITGITSIGTHIADNPVLDAYGYLPWMMNSGLAGDLFGGKYFNAAEVYTARVNQAQAAIAAMQFALAEGQKTDVLDPEQVANLTAVLPGLLAVGFDNVYNALEGGGVQLGGGGGVDVAAWQKTHAETIAKLKQHAMYYEDLKNNSGVKDAGNLNLMAGMADWMVGDGGLSTYSADPAGGEDADGDELNDFWQANMDKWHEINDSLAAELNAGMGDAFGGAGGVSSAGLNLLGEAIADRAQEDKDARARLKAEKEREEALLAQLTNVWWINGDQKAKALKNVLGEFPGQDLGGDKRAPGKGPFVPKYTKGAVSFNAPGGVGFQGKPVPMRMVTNIPRTAEAFDSMFPYLHALGFDTFKLAKMGAVAGVNTQKGITWAPAGILGNYKNILPYMAHWSTNQPIDWKLQAGAGANYLQGGRQEMLYTGLFMGGGKGIVGGLKLLTDGVNFQQERTQQAIQDTWAMTMGQQIEQPFTDALQNLGLIDNAGNPNFPWLQNPGAMVAANAAAAPNQPIRRATGGPIDWSPRGTDTVPAMLTPGEFVMRKSAVDKYGMGFMQAINGGKIGARRRGYFNEGGAVGDSQFAGRDGIGELLKDMSSSLTSIDGSNRNILLGQRTLQRNQQAGFGAVEGGLGTIGPEITARFDDLVARLDGAFFNNFGGYQFNSGGGVPGSGNRDTVPAMLTPGEFVMKKSAVQKYGLGFMRAINGSSPSVRVGRGVQYKHEGDVMGAGSSIDFSGLSNSISQLGNQVSTSLSAFETAFLGFSKLSSMISDTINSIANLNITHTVNISGSLSIPGFSQQAIDGIVKVISEQITNSTDGKIRRALRKFKRDQDNRT